MTARRAVAVALYRALTKDPFYRTIAGAQRHDPSIFETALVRYFEYALDEAEAIGRLVVDDEQLGAAAWFLPIAPGIAHEAKIQKERVLYEVLSEAGLVAYQQITEFMSQQRSRVCIPSNAWYLSIIGIAPQAQGRGLGRKLLKPMLAEADAATASCYLETFSMRNVTFYTRLGFGVVGRPHEPTTGAHYAIMLRRPHPDSSNIAPDLASTI